MLEEDEYDLKIGFESAQAKCAVKALIDALDPYYSNILSAKFYVDSELKPEDPEWDKTTEWERKASSCVWHLYGYGAFLRNTFEREMANRHVNDDADCDLNNHLQCSFDVMRASFAPRSSELKKVIYSYIFEGITATEEGRAGASSCVPGDLRAYWEEYLNNHVDS